MSDEWNDRVDIGTEVRSLCSKLGIDFDATGKLTIWPTKAEADVFVRNEHGSFHVKPGTHEANMEHLEFKVKCL